MVHNKIAIFLEREDDGARRWRSTDFFVNQPASLGWRVYNNNTSGAVHGRWVSQRASKQASEWVFTVRAASSHCCAALCQLYVSVAGAAAGHESSQRKKQVQPVGCSMPRNNCSIIPWFWWNCCVGVALALTNMGLDILFLFPWLCKLSAKGLILGFNENFLSEDLLMKY